MGLGDRMRQNHFEEGVVVLGIVAKSHFYSSNFACKTRDVQSILFSIFRFLRKIFGTKNRAKNRGMERKMQKRKIKSFPFAHP